MKLPIFKDQAEAFSFALKGHQDAINFVLLCCTILHLWDDLEDRDKPVSKARVDEAMYMALIVLPRNRFYQDHFHDLNPILDSAILNWHAANEMERTEERQDKEISFVIRSEYCNLLITSARIVGGYQWARDVTANIRRFWHKEGFAGYLQNLSLQFEQEKERAYVL